MDEEVQCPVAKENTNRNLKLGEYKDSSMKKKISRKPECSRCKNHAIHIGVKGHKRFCPYGHCVCSKCILTAERQRIMAQQVKLRREQAQDEEMEKLRELNEPKNCPDTVTEERNKENETTEEQNTIWQNAVNDKEVLTKNNSMQQDTKLENIQIVRALESLLSMLDISDEFYLIGIYSLLKESKFNAAITYNKMIQAKEDLKHLQDSYTSSISGIYNAKHLGKCATSLQYQKHCYPSYYLFHNVTKLRNSSDINNTDTRFVNEYEYFLTERNNRISKTDEIIEGSENNLPKLLRVVPSPSLNVNY